MSDKDLVESDDSEIEVPEDEAEAALLAVEEEEEEELEAGRLTGRQKLTVLLTVVVSFVIFSIILLPYDLLLREFVFSRIARMVRIDFSSMDLNLFSSDEIEDLSVTLPDGSFVKAASVVSGIKYRDMLAEHPQGTITLNDAQISIGNFAVESSAIQVVMNLRNIRDGMAKWLGSLSVRTGKLNTQRLEGLLPVSLPLEGLVMNSLTVNLRFAQGRMTFDGTRAVTNFFAVSFNGAARLAAGGFSSARLDGKICVKPADDLEEKNNTLFGYYLAAGGAAGGEKCFSLRGTPKSPSFNPMP